MIYRVNGEKRELQDGGLTVDAVLAQERVQNPELVAVQFNGDFLDRKLFGATNVKEGDEVEFVYFMGGGQG